MSEYGEASARGCAKGVPAASYGDYLRLPALLALQHPLADPAVHDEMLFIIVHQTHELWFKQVVLELAASTEHIDARRWHAAEHCISRVSKIVGLLIGHIEVLETMPATEFARFRGLLGSASGMQSDQFKQIEELSVALPPAAGAAGPRSCSVRHALMRALFGEGQAAAASPEDWRQVFRDPARPRERRLAESLLHFDAELLRWRDRHVELAHTMIGDTMGTGGSPGVRYLQGTLDKRLFPELWAARAEVEPGPAGEPKVT